MYESTLKKTSVRSIEPGRGAIESRLSLARGIRNNIYNLCARAVHLVMYRIRIRTKFSVLEYPLARFVHLYEGLVRLRGFRVFEYSRPYAGVRAIWCAMNIDLVRNLTRPSYQ